VRASVKPVQSVGAQACAAEAGPADTTRNGRFQSAVQAARYANLNTLAAKAQRRIPRPYAWRGGMPRAFRAATQSIRNQLGIEFRLMNFLNVDEKSPRVRFLSQRSLRREGKEGEI